MTDKNNRFSFVFAHDPIQRSCHSQHELPPTLACGPVSTARSPVKED